MRSTIVLFSVLALAVVQQVTALPAPHEGGERSIKRGDDEGGQTANGFLGLVNAVPQDLLNHNKCNGKLSIPMQYDKSLTFLCSSRRWHVPRRLNHTIILLASFGKLLVSPIDHQLA